MDSTEHNPKSYHDLLLELMALRESNYDLFLNKLYEALTGEFKYRISDDAPVTEKKDALSIMIKYFENKEEYEKCAKLKALEEELQTKHEMLHA